MVIATNICFYLKIRAFFKIEKSIFFNLVKKIKKL